MNVLSGKHVQSTRSSKLIYSCIAGQAWLLACLLKPCRTLHTLLCWRLACGLSHQLQPARPCFSKRGTCLCYYIHCPPGVALFVLALVGSISRLGFRRICCSGCSSLFLFPELSHSTCTRANFLTMNTTAIGLTSKLITGKDKGQQTCTGPQHDLLLASPRCSIALTRAAVERYPFTDSLSQTSARCACQHHMSKDTNV